MIAVDALLFDLDGTLIDSRRDLTYSVRALQEHYKHRPSTENEVASFVGDGVAKLVARSLPQLHARALEEAVNTFKGIYRDHCLDHTHAYAGVRKTLRHFGGKKMAIVTNKPARVSARILDGLSLSHYFAVLVGGDSLPNKKPHPEPVLSAIKSLGLQDPKRIVLVGDGPNDIHSGRAAGTITCGINSNIGNPHQLIKSKPDFMVKNLFEITRLFV